MSVDFDIIVTLRGKPSDVLVVYNQIKPSINYCCINMQSTMLVYMSSVNLTDLNTLATQNSLTLSSTQKNTTWIYNVNAMNYISWIQQS